MGRPAREKNEITALMATRLNMLNEERKRALEKEKGRRVSSTEIAKKLEIPQSSYSEYLRDMQTPSLETIKKLANYFNVTVDYLMGSSNVRNPDQYFQTLDKTKLSDKAIQTLLDNPEVLPFINSFIERTDLLFRRNYIIEDSFWFIELVQFIYEHIFVFIFHNLFQ